MNKIHIYITLTVLLLFISEYIYGQSGLGYYERQKEMEYRITKLNDDEKTVQEHHWRLISNIDSNTCLLYRDYDNAFYLGSVKYYGDGKVLRNGIGLSFEKGEFYYCNWKRDVKNGSGIVKTKDDEILTCIWKWDRLKYNNVIEASERQKDSIETSIKRMLTLIKIADVTII